MSSVPDSRSTSKPGESRNDHFNDAQQRAVMAGVFKSRKSDQDDLTFPEAPGDD